METIGEVKEGAESKQEFIYQLIYTPDMARKQNPFERSPTLGTVLMVEKTINKYSGEFNRREIWQKLPKKVMWQTYLVVIDYLETTNKIAFDREDHVAYIWNPELAKRFRKMKAVRV